MNDEAGEERAHLAARYVVPALRLAAGAARLVVEWWAVNGERFTIRLFGPRQILVGAEPMPRVRTRSVEWLLALLVLRHGRTVERSWLAGTLWPESPETQALQNLRNDLVSLRKALGPEGVRLQSPSRGTLTLDLADADVDVLRFDQAVRIGDEAALGRAIAAYTGPLLEGCYGAWAVPERESRAAELLTALETLADRAKERGDLKTAVGHLRRAETADPLRASTVRRLMQVLDATGDPAAAIEVYRRFRLRLHEERAGAPDEATTLLFQQIRTHARPPATPAPSPESRPGRRQARPPLPLAPLIGREQEADAISRSLTDRRLVTLVGAGGVGKTRLAMEVAAGAHERFAGGAVWVELAPLADGSLLLPTLATALDIRQEGATDLGTLQERLTDALSGQDILLALDNCEHLLDPVAELVRRLVSRCPGLRVLATSRQRLGLAGEEVRRVPSLSTPDVAALPADPADAAGAVLDFPAARLFVERAAAARPGFRLAGREEVEALCHICRRLDGIPLALELAAARANVLSVEQIAARLDDRFRLLAAGSRSDPPRQRTLRALIDWSYELLTDDERRLLLRLAVFAGGCTLEAAEAVFDDDPETLEVLASLVERSLLFAEDQVGGLRYRMQETVRDYGLQRLTQSGDEATARERHARYCLVLAEEARAHVRQPEAVWLDRLEGEHDNLRAALAWLVASSATQEAAQRLVAALEPFWDYRGHFYEMRTGLLTLALRATPPTLARAEVLSRAAELVAGEGDYTLAKRLFTERLEIVRACGDRRAEAAALNGLVRLLGDPMLSGQEYDPVTARALAEEGLAVMRALDDREGMAQSLFRLGCMAHQAGDDDEAWVRWSECRLLDEALGVRGGHVLPGLGDIALDRGDFAAARECYRQFLTYRHGIGDRWCIAWGLQRVGALALAEGDPESAARLAAASLALREAIRPLSAEGREPYDALRRAIGAVLDAARLRVAWDAGGAMPCDEAVAFALALTAR